MILPQGLYLRLSLVSKRLQLLGGVSLLLGFQPRLFQLILGSACFFVHLYQFFRYLLVLQFGFLKQEVRLLSLVFGLLKLAIEQQYDPLALLLLRPNVLCDLALDSGDFELVLMLPLLHGLLLSHGLLGELLELLDKLDVLVLQGLAAFCLLLHLAHVGLEPLHRLGLEAEVALELLHLLGGLEQLCPGVCCLLCKSGNVVRCFHGRLFPAMLGFLEVILELLVFVLKLLALEFEYVDVPTELVYFLTGLCLVELTLFVEKVTGFF